MLFIDAGDIIQLYPLYLTSFPLMVHPAKRVFRPVGIGVHGYAMDF